MVADQIWVVLQRKHEFAAAGVDQVSKVFGKDIGQSTTRHVLAWDIQESGKRYIQFCEVGRRPFGCTTDLCLPTDSTAFIGDRRRHLVRWFGRADRRRQVVESPLEMPVPHAASPRRDIAVFLL